jgi:branched-chain amino acid transport system substrate-binding protein
MVGLTVGVDLPKFYEVVGRDAEFVYGSTLWLPELVELRAGGLIPVGRQYPGTREFVESSKKEFPGADLSYHSAAGYGGCQILVEATRRAGSLDSGKLRDAIRQDGKKVIVWPEEQAPVKARFPTPPWSQRP